MAETKHFLKEINCLGKKKNQTKTLECCCSSNKTTQTKKTPTE